MDSIYNNNKIFLENSFDNVLSNTTLHKINNFPIKVDSIGESKPLIRILDKMHEAYVHKISISSAVTINPSYMKAVFVEFYRKFNHSTTSKFEHDLNLMDVAYQFEFFVENSLIQLNFLTNAKNKNYVSVILHAVNTFCWTFPSNYNNLKLYVCLDDNQRNLTYSGENPNYETIFKNLQDSSGAFNVCGVTVKSTKKIILTKTEEIIKLLFHEMIHFIGLDNVFFTEFDSQLSSQKVNLSEAYTETVSVILNSMYQTIQFYGLKDIDKNKFFINLLQLETNYSIYLSANILKFYNYNSNTYTNFFKDYNHKIKCPVLIYEYVFLRTMLLLNLKNIEFLADKFFKVETKDLGYIIDEMTPSVEFFSLLRDYMDQTPQSNNISYTLVDFDWNRM